MSEATASGKSVVGVLVDCTDIDGVATNSVRTRYLEALADTADVIAVLIPTTLTSSDVETLVCNRLDGILLTGSSSNVHPARYSQPLRFDQRLTDPARDSVAIAAICSAITHEKPVMGICRGLQEINVAFGGTLYQDLSSDPGTILHHEDLSRPRDEQYLPAHTVSLAPESKLFPILGPMGSEIQVNSLHRQGIHRLGAGLSADAVAPDGVIEAISATTTGAPMFAVQWHLEWYHKADPVSRALLGAFASFCDQRRMRRARVNSCRDEAS
jgi:putative glutamine amidotransferase